jgi:hypothetical protein
MNLAAYLAVPIATAVVLASFFSQAETAPSATPRIQLKGIAHIDAHAANAMGPTGQLVLSGRVSDDTATGPATRLPPTRTHSGASAGSRSLVALRLTRGAAGAIGGAPQTTDGAGGVQLASCAPEPCDPGGLRPVLEAPDRLLLPLEDDSRFCVHLTLPGDRYVARLEVPPSELMDGARVDLSIDPALAPVTLTFDPEVSILSLDGETATVDVTATMEVEGAMRGAGHAAAGVELTFSSESGADLGSTITTGSGRGRVVVPTAHLGPPGKGELRVSFAGNASTAATTRTVAIERRTRVEIAAPDAIAGTLPAAPVEDGVTVRVAATAGCAARGCAASPTGTVVARANDGDPDAIVGAARLEGGVARVVVRLGTPALPAAGAALRFRYVPDAPWFEAKEELRLVQPVRPPGPWSTVALVVAGVGVLAWLSIARFPMRTGADVGESAPRRATESGPGVELVRPGAAGRWAGKIIDAHEGAALAGARVAIERAGFENVQVLGQTSSDASGSFVLESTETRPGDELVAEAPLHDQVRQPLPPPGEVEVALVQRRRMLLDRLVAWARRRGKPFDARPEPTPGHVRRAAGRLEFEVDQRARAEEIEQWATAVERAAYGGAPVDARAQAKVDDLAPPDASKPGAGVPEPRMPPRAR